MSAKNHFTYPSADGVTQIHGICWTPAEAPRAILQIAHGMVEYIDRYDDFAKFLNALGILVTGNDHLGHGESVVSQDDWGYFADRNSLDTVLEDMHALTRLTKAKYPGLPYILLGHSMGSFLTRNWICRWGGELSGVILMGTGFQPKALVQAGKRICALLAKWKGWRHRSRFVDSMAFGGYNRTFEPARTKRDWLTRDEEMVDRYLADPGCSFLFTLNGYHTLFSAIERLHDREMLAEMPKDLPVLFVSGEADPVGDFGKGVRMSADTFLAAGMRDVDLWLYPGRHEILNETDRDLVYGELARWLTDIAEGKHIPVSGAACCGEADCDCRQQNGQRRGFGRYTC